MPNEATVRAVRASDGDLVRAVHLAAFETAAEADLVDALVASGAAVISLVATERESVVGHILFSRLAAPMPALALAPVAVIPSRQNAGIGSVLVRAGLAAAAKDGWTAAFVLGEPAFYRRFGFSVEAARNFRCRYAGPYLMAVTLGSTPLPKDGELGYPTPFTALGGACPVGR